MVARWENYLNKLYNDPSRPGSFSSPDKLYRAVKKEGKYVISRKKIHNWLAKQEPYTLHRKVNRKFKRRKVVVRGIDNQWDCDVGYMEKYSKENRGYKYILLTIDVFSRFVSMRPLVRKTGKSVERAFQEILTETRRKPDQIRTDKGTEFIDKGFRNFLKKQDIKYFTSDNELKSNYAERAIKTIKSKLFRYMTAKNTFQWVDALSTITKTYNKSFHRSIGMSPNEVNEKNEVGLWMRLYSASNNQRHKAQQDKTQLGRTKKLKSSLVKSKRRFKYKVDDTVRITHVRSSFQREYNERWTREHFIIVDRSMKADIPVYRLKDYNNEPITGTFYESELQKIVVDKETPYKIEKVLSNRARKGKREMYVKFLGWPEKFNAWIPSRSVIPLDELAQPRA